MAYAKYARDGDSADGRFEWYCMIVRFQKENLLLEAEDTLISVGGLGISPRQALTVFGIKKIKQVEREKTGGIFRRFFHNSVKIL